jgi:uncharacterized protein
MAQGTGAGMKIGVISDTHGKLRPEVFEHFAGVDLIVHAGDIGPPGILDDLAVLAPVIAVYGNTDDMTVRHLVPAVAEQEVGGRLLLVTHGHEFGSPTPALLRSAHPNADIIVFGHTHRPVIEPLGDCLVINPGGAGAPRFGLRPSVALLELGDGVPEARLVDL